MNICLRPKIFKTSLLSNVVRLSTASPEIIEQNEQVLIVDTDDALAREAEIEKKRNKSRLSEPHFNIIHGRRAYETPKCIAHLTVKYNRKMYGKYGSASGVNPSLCWPTKEDIQEKLEYESVAYPFTIKEMMESAAKKRREEQLAMEKRQQEIIEKFAKLKTWKKELKDKLAKKVSDAQAAKDKKERLVEEVRRHFGFTLDPRDDRFKEMLAKREKEQKKIEKQARKEAREKVMIAQIQKKSVEMG